MTMETLQCKGHAPDSRRSSETSIYTRLKMDQNLGPFVIAGFIIALVLSFIAKVWKLSVSLPSLGDFSFVDSIIVAFHTIEWLSFNNFLGATVLGVIAYVLHVIFVRPLNRVKILGDVGYLEEGKFTKKEIANAVRKRRVVGDVPPVYPNGWFGIIESRFLKKGESKTVSMLGLNLAIFRGENGEAHAIDAYCPHMGANLGAGGRVEGDCIECPFHGWKFRGYDGQCTEIPYAEKVPEFARVKSYTTKEINGWLCIWHHAEGLEPTWDLPEIEEIASGQWKYRGRTEHHVNAHIEEIPENGADVFHLSQVHGPLLAAGVDLRYMWNKIWSFGKHEWTAAWQQNSAPEEHIGTLSLTHKMVLGGIHFSMIDLEVSARQIGPAVVYLTFSSVFGNGVFVQHVIPTEPMVQKVVHNIYMDWKCPVPIAKCYLVAEALQVERDLMIWNNKRYAGKPMFVKSKEDNLIAKHRRWYSQFYSEHSPKLSFTKESLSW